MSHLYTQNIFQLNFLSGCSRKEIKYVRVKYQGARVERRSFCSKVANCNCQLVDPWGCCRESVDPHYRQHLQVDIPHSQQNGTECDGGRVRMVGMPCSRTMITR